MANYGNFTFYSKFFKLYLNSFSKRSYFFLGFFPVAPISKSSTRQRHFYDEAQLSLLDAEFARDSFPNRESRRRIALLIGVSEKSVMVSNLLLDLFFFITLNKFPYFFLL